ncbi:RNA polymerase sigma-70 factor (ECF subfamily) [Pedobacter sp. AK017]|uniref:RNA polymerase sigma factor n=1 Tax=Pedobacter sp. AK017 TaxID=2723073 RepID=UPI00160D21B9|nr:RNA polymerase sigma factor [Pedobacter sp. AK017]MBB5437207.1 RNA polymerase sigma-70 factor (ECF subfamily) [Pedobacter sp. AK017]
MEPVYIDKNAALINGCRRGDRKAQFEIYKLYAKAMYNVALRIVNFEEEAEDVLQDSFLDAFTRIDNFKGEATFGLWLKQIVINKSINQLRKRKVEFVNIEEVDVAEENEPAEDLQWKVEEIRTAVAMLPDRYRVVLTLYLFEGYDHEEIAYILKITEGTSRTQYMRAKMKLNDLLAKRGV